MEERMEVEEKVVVKEKSKKKIPLELEESSNRYAELSTMVYLELPALISRIAFMALENCQLGLAHKSPSDIQFIEPTLEEVKKVADSAIEGSLITVTNILEAEKWSFKRISDYRIEATNKPPLQN